MALPLALFRQTCCVAGCTNSYASMTSSGETIKFYRFPTQPNDAERRSVWISAIRRTRGGDWKPNHTTRICSRHFIGNGKSDDPGSPSYNPSIFPWKQSTPCPKRPVVAQPQPGMKRTHAPESQGHCKQAKKRKACAFELQSVTINDSTDDSQPDASLACPTIEIDGKDCTVKTCEAGTMTSREVREVGTMMPFKACDERQRVKRRHVGTVTYLKPGEFPRRPYAFFCVSDGKNVSTQTWCKYISMQSAQTDTVVPPGHSVVVINNAALKPGHKAVSFAGGKLPKGCRIVAVRHAAAGPDMSLCSAETQSEASAAPTRDRSLAEFRNAAVGPDYKSVCFTGTQSVHKDDESMLSLCAVNRTMFALVMSIIPDTRPLRDISKADRLTLFLMKLKTGLTYGALGALFGIHPTSVARCFISVLNLLFDKTRSWIEWKHSDDVRTKKPDYFKLHYPNCKILIDCTGARVAQPAPVEIQDFYTSSKGTYSAKFLFGVAPNGALTFVRSAEDKGGFLDEFTAVASSVNPGGVLIDKSSVASANSTQANEVRSNSPSLNREGTNSDVCDAGHSMYSVRLHVDRMILKLKSFNILNLPLSSNLHDNIDRIVHVICILANLQGSVLKSSGPDV